MRTYSSTKNSPTVSQKKKNNILHPLSTPPFVKGERGILKEIWKKNARNLDNSKRKKNKKKKKERFLKKNKNFPILFLLTKIIQNLFFRNLCLPENRKERSYFYLFRSMIRNYYLVIWTRTIPNLVRFLMSSPIKFTPEMFQDILNIFIFEWVSYRHNKVRLIVKS
jgi:hypothetical protein